MKKKYLCYRIFKTILKPIFKLYYNPKIINREAIPKEGPIIMYVISPAMGVKKRV